MVLSLHELTITRLRWSPDGRSLLAVSRDRSFSVWEWSDSNRDPHCPLVLKLHATDAHRRMINDGVITPDGRAVITGGREGTVKVWSISQLVDESNKQEEGQQEQQIPGAAPTARLTLPQFPSAVTALDICAINPNGSNDSAVLAVGEESGRVSLWCGERKPQSGWCFALAHVLRSDQAHVDTVHTLRLWSSSCSLLMVSGGADTSLRVIRLTLRKSGTDV